MLWLSTFFSTIFVSVASGLLVGIGLTLAKKIADAVVKCRNDEAKTEELDNCFCLGNCGSFGLGYCCCIESAFEDDYDKRNDTAINAEDDDAERSCQNADDYDEEVDHFLTAGDVGDFEGTGGGKLAE